MHASAVGVLPGITEALCGSDQCVGGALYISRNGAAAFGSRHEIEQAHLVPQIHRELTVPPLMSTLTIAVPSVEPIRRDMPVLQFHRPNEFKRPFNNISDVGQTVVGMFWEVIYSVLK